MFENIARIPLGFFPTPLEELSRLREALGGPRLLVKRDDLTGLAGGGNKTRKLELLMADALARRADTVITVGAAQSNHARQTAAAAAKLGLRCVLALRSGPPSSVTGNLLLDDLLGAEVRWVGARDAADVMAEIAEEERAAGRSPYLVPYGGSNAIGASAYVLAMSELQAQLEREGMVADRIVLASSSGGTQAGVTVGAKAVGYSGDVLGISISDRADVLRSTVVALAHAAAARLGQHVSITPGDIEISDAYLGGGYGVMGEAEREAIRLVARTEGLLLDPVYTGRAMAGLIDLIRGGAFSRDETILFWHTGGTPALYAYAEALQ